MAKLKDLISEYGEYEVSDELIAQFKKPSPKTIWDLKKGDNHHWVDITGDVCINVPWQDSKEDKLAREIGNVFLTREEAEKEEERRKVETLLLKYGGRRWFIKGESNMFLYYDARFKTLRYEIKTILPVQGTIYFDSFEKLDKAVKAIGEERIINALFEVR